MAEAANRKSGHNVAGSRSILRIEQFRLADIMRILGIPKWKALNYVKSGHITPSIQDSSGPGTRRISGERVLVTSRKRSGGSPGCMLLAPRRHRLASFRLGDLLILIYYFRTRRFDQGFLKFS